MSWSVRDTLVAVGGMVLFSSLAALVLMGVSGEFISIGPLVLGMVSTLFGMVLALKLAFDRGGPALFNLGEMRREHLLQAIALGGAGLLLGFGWEWLVEAAGGTVSEQGLIQDIGALDDPWVLAFAAVYITILAPITEETLFRGFMQPAWVERYGRWVGIWCTAVVFGLMHIADPMTVPLVILIGVLAGWLRERSGGVGVPIVYHMANNTFSLVAYALFGV